LAAWPTHAGGHLAVGDDQLWAYDAQGIHRLDPAQRAAELEHILPNSLLNYGDIAVLPEGDTVVVHRDPARTSLLALTAAGKMRWRHSLGRIPGEKRLLALGGDVYLVAQQRTSSFSGIALYGIDLASGTLTRVFDGGSRLSASTGTWVTAAGEGQVLVNLQGVGLVALDPESAREAVVEASAQ
jgi:outer membrane protein assembly factor BamB